MTAHIIVYLLIAGVAAFTPAGFPTIPFVRAAGPTAAQHFDGTGVLHDIHGSGVVVNDIYHLLAPGAVFKSADARVSDKSSFQRGDRVGFYKDGKGRIVEIWRLIRQKDLSGQMEK